MARDLARRRLARLNEPTPEQIAAEDEEARKEGYIVERLPDGLSIWIKKYTAEGEQ